MIAKSAMAARRPITFFNKLLRWWFRRSEHHVIHGIPVALAWPTPEEQAVILPKIEAALRLIHDHDPRRLRRLQRHIDGIFVYSRTGPLGSFHPGVRLVNLRFSHVTDPQSTAAEVASTLVHEGTHARLSSLGFRYEPERRARIEGACHRAERAFARRLPDPGDRIEQTERDLQRDASTWSYAAWRRRGLSELRELGAPPFFVALVEGSMNVRDRFMESWMGPPP